MKIGMCLPTETGTMGSGTPTANDVIRLGRLAEQVGFDSVWVVDHFLYEAGTEQAALGSGPPAELIGVRYGAWEALTVAAGLGRGHTARRDRDAGGEHGLSQPGPASTHG